MNPIISCVICAFCFFIFGALLADYVSTHPNSNPAWGFPLALLVVAPAIVAGIALGFWLHGIR